jgi:hypothetical protein
LFVYIFSEGNIVNEDDFLYFIPKTYCHICWQPILWDPTEQRTIYMCVCLFGGHDWLVGDSDIAPSNATITQQQRTVVPSVFHVAFTDDEVTP